MTAQRWVKNSKGEYIVEAFPGKGAGTPEVTEEVLNVGDESTIMGVESVLANTKTIGSVRYEIFSGRQLRENRAAVRITDEDTGSVVTLKQYPNYDVAEKEYNNIIGSATRAEQPPTPKVPAVGEGREKRLAEAKRLEDENREILATPLMSEGEISPMQVGLFSARQKARWQKNAQAKMGLQFKIKQLRRSDEEIASAEKISQDITEKERLSSIEIIKGKIAFIEGLGRMSHKPNGQLRIGYQRTVDSYNAEIEKLKTVAPKH